MIYYIIFSIGIIFIVLGVISLIRVYANTKSFLHIYALTNEVQRFEIKRTGLYSISFIGGGTVKPSSDFKIEASLHKNADIEQISVKHRNIKYRFLFQGSIGVEYYEFTINSPGIVEFAITNSDSLIVKPSMLISKQVFQQPIHKSAIKVLVRKTTQTLLPTLYTLISVIGFLLCIIGLNLLLLTE